MTSELRFVPVSATRLPGAIASLKPLNALATESIETSWVVCTGRRQTEPWPILADYVGVFKKETVGSSDLDPPGSRSVTIRCGIVAEMHELFLVAFGDAHQHHEKCQAIPGPPAEPADPPLAEARVDRDWSFQAQESGFEAHACDIHGSGAAHSQGIGRTKPPSKPKPEPG